MVKSSQPLPADKAIDLYNALVVARRLQLHPALATVVREIGVTIIDTELHRLVPAEALNHVGALGLRGELVFPVPSVLLRRPPLLGYYRMLLSLSKKEFGQVLGYSRWLGAEQRGEIPERFAPDLEELCAVFIAPLVQLVYAMREFGERDLSDLALLTLGPSLQGGRNNVIGSRASKLVFDAVKSLVIPWVTFERDYQLIRFEMPKGLQFELVASSDPDLRVDAIEGSSTAPLLTIEIKGGDDTSNLHNRAGEAEKSQIKARQAGYEHRWTVIRMGGSERTRVEAETPSSTLLFEAQQIMDQSGADWKRFVAEFHALIGA